MGGVGLGGFELHAIFIPLDVLGLDSSHLAIGESLRLLYEVSKYNFRHKKRIFSFSLNDHIRPSESQLSKRLIAQTKIINM